MQKCKIKSVKKIGKQKTYNVTMKSPQHNYKVVSPCGSVISRNSHSASYAFLAYQTAYLKYYYPIEFMCNLLTSVVMDDDQMNLYRKEAERTGIRVVKPDINKSGKEFIIDEVKMNDRMIEVIRAPFTALKGVGTAAVNEITAKQPFSDLKDFLSKVDGRKVTSKVFNVLIASGCTDLAWKGTRKQFLSEYDIIKKQISKEKKEMKKQEEDMNEFQGSLFDAF